MQTLTKLFKEHALLKELAEPHIETLVGCAKNVRFAAGDYLYREGEEDSLTLHLGALAPLPVRRERLSPPSATSCVFELDLGRLFARLDADRGLRRRL